MTYNLKVNEICSIPLNTTNTNILVPTKPTREKGGREGIQIYFFPPFFFVYIIDFKHEGVIHVSL